MTPQTASTPILFFAFANDREHSLRQLAVEGDALREIFHSAEREGKCRLISLFSATPEKIIKAFQRNEGRIRVFHYGGHSSDDALFLWQDQAAFGPVKAAGLAGFLARQNGLELVFLNGCGNEKQARLYEQAGIKSMILTSRQIGDLSAREFARLFYRGLVGGKTLGQAYAEAEAAFPFQFEKEWRGIALRKKTDTAAFPWRLLPAGNHDWRLPLSAKRLSRIPAIDLKNDFIGRKKDLERLTKIMESSAKVVLMNGLGGIGKTVLATAYVQTLADRYDHLVWINRGEDLIASVALNEELAESLGLPFEKGEELAVRFRRILWTLQQLPGRNLLIIDNAQTQVAHQEIYDLLPGRPNWRTLLTSRLDLPGFERMRLDTLSPEAARQLFRTHYRGEYTEAELEALLREIDYHTLTVELMARLLNKLNQLLRLPELTAMLQKKQLDDPDLQELIWTRHRGRERGIYLHLMKAFELSDLEAKERGLLQQFIVLPVENYPAAVLADFLREKALQLNKTLNSLAAKGWLNRDENGAFSIHRLIRQVAAYQLRPTAADLEGLLETMIAKMSQDAYTNPITDNFPWVSYADALIVYLDGEEHKRIAVLQNNLANIYFDLGQYARARDLLEAALASDLKNFGAEHPTVAVRQSNLANVYLNLGEYARARDLLEAALANAMKNFGEEHASTAIRLSKLGGVYQALGQEEKARPLEEKALRIFEKTLGEAHPYTKQLRDFLGNLQS